MESAPANSEPKISSSTSETRTALNTCPARALAGKRRSLSARIPQATPGMKCVHRPIEPIATPTQRAPPCRVSEPTHIAAIRARVTAPPAPLMAGTRQSSSAVAANARCQGLIFRPVPSAVIPAPIAPARAQSSRLAPIPSPSTTALTSPDTPAATSTRRLAGAAVRALLGRNHSGSGSGSNGRC